MMRWSAISSVSADSIACSPGVFRQLHLRCRLTDAGQPSVERVRGMFAALHGPSGSAAPGHHLSDEEDAEYAPKQPDSQVTAKDAWLKDCSAVQLQVLCAAHVEGHSTHGRCCVHKRLPHCPIHCRQVGAKWLADWCMSNSSEVPGTEVSSLAITIASAVLSGGLGDELAAELFNLLGDAHFESIQVDLWRVVGMTRACMHTV
jgi:hypothetical protein